MTTPALELRGVARTFARPLNLLQRAANRLGADHRPQTVHAVDGVDLAIHHGEILGLVGESGCGKSTVGRMAAGILPPSSGEILHEGRDVRTLSGDAARRYALGVQMVFQNPFASLSPRLRVGEAIGEAARVHGVVPRRELDDYLDHVMRLCGLDPAFKHRYPHQFSGGQRQRIVIARALAVKPQLLVCDEAVAALDVSIQAQILNLFIELRRELGLNYLFISHDLGVVEHVSDRVAIMYLGRIVETAPTTALFREPRHPYTRALLAEVPRIENRKRRFQPIRGEIPSPLAPPPGCHFHPRCPMAIERCRLESPRLLERAPGHWSACHLDAPAVPHVPTQESSTCAA